MQIYLLTSPAQVIEILDQQKLSFLEISCFSLDDRKILEVWTRIEKAFKAISLEQITFHLKIRTK
uniref:Uncharacterized protein n=1 Tax=Romanomermis culicivorax TaxID=13658 RepID=A0A915IYT0_ROMCU